MKRKRVLRCTSRGIFFVSRNIATTAVTFTVFHLAGSHRPGISLGPCNREIRRTQHRSHGKIIMRETSARAIVREKERVVIVTARPPFRVLPRCIRGKDYRDLYSLAILLLSSSRTDRDSKNNSRSPKRSKVLENGRNFSLFPLSFRYVSLTIGFYAKAFERHRRLDKQRNAKTLLSSVNRATRGTTPWPRGRHDRGKTYAQALRHASRSLSFERWLFACVREKKTRFPALFDL